ncbi:MAG: hypothetical protein L3K19_02785 [Thermoplasmata archaeon]|nr:hypothetical protein [Thermoplasmata archaeon]
MSRLAVLVAVATLAGLGSPLSSASAGAPPSPLAWSNGAILCNFTSDHPAVTVSALGAQETGLYAGVSQVEEVSSSGTVVASSSTIGSSWNITNLSSPRTLTLGYGATLPVRSSPTSAPIGSVAVSAHLSTGYDDDAAANVSQVAIHLVVSGWPWVSNSDRLAVLIPLWPAFSSTEQLVAASSNHSEVQSVSLSTGNPEEYFGWSSSALAGFPGGGSASVPVSAQLALAPAYATVTWTSGSGSGGASSLSFDSQVGVVLPARVLGIPLYEYGLAGGLAGLVAVVAAAGLRQVRKRPSTLEFVEGEER